MATKFAICLLVLSGVCAKQLNFDEDFFPVANEKPESESEDVEPPSWFQELSNPVQEPVQEEHVEPAEEPAPPQPAYEDTNIFHKPAEKQEPDFFHRPAEKPQNNYFAPEKDDYYQKPAENPYNNYFGSFDHGNYHHKPVERPQNNFFEKPSWFDQPAPPKRPQYQPQHYQSDRSKPKRAESCNLAKCQPPKCRCSDVYLSRDIDEKDVPQLVVVTFDDAVTALNYNYIKESMTGLRNPDGCPIQGTFFVSHEYTDYTKVHQLWSQGHEIALHSITHSPYTKYWRNATVETLVKEFGGQRQLMAHFANIDINDITGMRVPLFELPGNNSFLAMKQIGLTYDSSWPTQHFVSPGLWPYSLDYGSVQDCPIGSCPTASIPNVWVNPILSWEDTEGNRCSMIDACPYPPEDDVETIFNWMVGNFNKTFFSNRAPFGVYLHSSWFLKGDHHFEAFKRFLRYLNQNPDVYIVSSARVLEFVRNPKIGRPFDNCQPIREPTCKERFCRLMKVDTKTERWMKSCMPCPAVYPWIGNPFGKPIRQLNDH